MTRFLLCAIAFLGMAAAAGAAEYNPFDESYPMGLEYRIESRGTFAVIGKLGGGTVADRAEWLPPLWREASANIGELAGTIGLGPDGAPDGVWAIMSDHGGNFAPWDPVRGGQYLAGFEAVGAAPAPEGWVRWQVPGYRYVVARFPIAEYDPVLKLTMDAYLPAHGYTLAGAIHERYPDPRDPSQIELYFPIEKLR